MKANKFTSEQINFLKKLNALLRKKESEIWERCMTLTKQYEKRRKRFGGDLDDYEIELTVEFQTSPAMLRPRYCYVDSFSRTDYYDKDKKEERFGLADGNDHIDLEFPELDEKWCYIMHALWSHSNMKLKEIFKIFRMDFEIHITEQQFVSVVEHKIIV